MWNFSLVEFGSKWIRMGLSSSVKWVISILITKGKDLTFTGKSGLIRKHAQTLSYLGSCLELVLQSMVSERSCLAVPRGTSLDAKKPSWLPNACGILSLLLHLTYKAATCVASWGSTAYLALPDLPTHRASFLLGLLVSLPLLGMWSPSPHPRFLCLNYSSWCWKMPHKHAVL